MGEGQDQGCVEDEADHPSCQDRYLMIVLSSLLSVHHVSIAQLWCIEPWSFTPRRWPGTKIFEGEEDDELIIGADGQSLYTCLHIYVGV
jgi:hypothetical protein